MQYDNIVQRITELELQRIEILNAESSPFDDILGRSKRSKLVEIGETLEMLFSQKRKIDAARRNGQRV